ncbi:MAG: UbiA prenyltransferase family protein [Bacteroidota bacterium]
MAQQASIPPIIRLLRPEQWIKNLLIFMPAFFAQVITDQSLVLILLAGFFAFCLVASSIYIFNDYYDIEADRLHPKKKLRPLAAGLVTSKEAIFAGMVCLVIALVLMISIGITTFSILLGSYLVLTISYTLFLKKIAFVDLFVLAMGFLLRIFAGGELADVPISEWLVIMTFLGAMMIGLGKRRDEFILSEKTTTDIRPALNGYNLQFIDIAIVFVSAVTTVAYLMYTLSPEVTDRIGNNYVYFTSFFVIFGMLKYLQLTFVHGESGQPTRLFLQNPVLRFILLLWIITFALLLYVF